MKKIFLLLAFSGIIGASSAVTLASFHKATTVTFKQDEKKKKCCKKKEDHDCSKHAKGASDKKHDCSKHEKSKHDKIKDCKRHDSTKVKATPAIPPAR